MYDDLVEATGFDKDTLRWDRLVAESIESVRRRTDLSHSHHREVVSLETSLQDLLLDKAAKEELSVKGLRKEVCKARKLPNSKFY